MTGLNVRYGCATLSAVYVGYRYFLNHRVTPHIWVTKREDSLSWLALPTELLGYSTLMDTPP